MGAVANYSLQIWNLQCEIQPKLWQSSASSLLLRWQRADSLGAHAKAGPWLQHTACWRKLRGAALQQGTWQRKWTQQRMWPGIANAMTGRHSSHSLTETLTFSLPTPQATDLSEVDPSSPWANPAHHLALATCQAHTATSSALVHSVFLALKRGFELSPFFKCFLAVPPLEIPVLTLLVSFLTISVNQAGNQQLAEHYACRTCFSSGISCFGKIMRN